MLQGSWRPRCPVWPDPPTRLLSPVGPRRGVSRPSVQRAPQLRDRGSLFLGAEIGIARDDLDLVLDERALIRPFPVPAAEFFELLPPVGDGPGTGRGR